MMLPVGEAGLIKNQNLLPVPAQGGAGSGRAAGHVKSFSGQGTRNGECEMVKDERLGRIVTRNPQGDEAECPIAGRLGALLPEFQG